MKYLLYTLISFSGLIAAEHPNDYWNEKPTLCAYQDDTVCVCRFDSKKNPEHFTFVVFYECSELEKVFEEQKWIDLLEQLKKTNPNIKKL